MKLFLTASKEKNYYIVCMGCVGVNHDTAHIFYMVGEEEYTVLMQAQYNLKIYSDESRFFGKLFGDVAL